MTQNAYLVSVATAALLVGAGGSQVLNGLTARASQPVAHSAVVRLVLGTTAQTTLKNFLKTQLCGAVETQFGLAANECTEASFHANGVMLSWVDSDSDQVADKWEMASNLRVAGQWTPGGVQ